ncbi:hypothetical protein [Amycolatopsis sp. NPDC098790]|uniref:hypothetical protein n=1 Tax=Amycolatopsis sp. NPDC098790 TaxID=3363939 RepID=UPI0038028DE2
MTLAVYIVRPASIVVRAGHGEQTINGVAHFAYDRLAAELNGIGGLHAELAERDDIPQVPGKSVLDHSMGYIADESLAQRSITLLLEAERNSFLQVAQLDLLGCVTADGMQKWRHEETTELDRSLVGRRDIAESIDAAGGKILGPQTYCYVTRPDWTSLPAAISEYLRAALA